MLALGKHSRTASSPAPLDLWSLLVDSVDAPRDEI